MTVPVTAPEAVRICPQELSPFFAQIRAARLFAGAEAEEEKEDSFGRRSRSSSQDQERMAGVANRRQQQWETQLEDSVFLKGAIKPIVDDMTALKPLLYCPVYRRIRKWGLVRG